MSLEWHGYKMQHDWLVVVTHGESLIYSNVAVCMTFLKPKQPTALYRGQFTVFHLIFPHLSFHIFRLSFIILLAVLDFL